MNNILVRSFPTKNDLNNKFIFSDDIKHVINLCTKSSFYEQWFLWRKGITYVHLATGEMPMDFSVILQGVQLLKEYDQRNEKTIIHCFSGNNRSRSLAEAFYFCKYGHHLIDEYKGCTNHLIFNCTNHFLPPLFEVEKLLRNISDINTPIF